MNDLYTLIGSSRDATREELQSRIEAKMIDEQVKYDAGDQFASEVLFNLREAKQVLLDDKKRKIYNSKMSQTAIQAETAAIKAAAKLTKCSVCSGTVSKHSKTCPHCGQPLPAIPLEALGKHYFWGTILFLATVWSFSHWSHQSKEDDQRSIPPLKASKEIDDRRSHPATTSRTETEPRVRDLSSAAFIICKNHITNRLKSPSTAVFQFLDYSSINLGQERYVVKSYVDSQNSFGAMIRTTFLCQLRFTGTDQADIRHWELEGISTKP
jgi:hypothetical protein